MREFFTIAIFKIKADIRMNKTTLNSQKEKHSMLSLRRATVITTLATSRRTISIHALLAESDPSIQPLVCDFANFYPRSPCGERPARPPRKRGCGDFYPRSPCGERLHFEVRWKSQRTFLSTLSLRRATLRRAASTRTPCDFYPRSPCGERQTGTWAVASSWVFLSTLSLRRATV